jgi:hypothetical protein
MTRSVEDETTRAEEQLLTSGQHSHSDRLDLQALSLSSLVHRCRRATDRYFQGLSFDEQCCLELFRRALRKGDEGAWSALVAQYDGLVRSWIHRHQSFDVADEEGDYFLNRTFDKFWHAFHNDPGKFDRFVNVKSILQYLKLCAYTSVQEYVERQMRPYDLPISSLSVDALSSESEGITSLKDRLAAGAVWSHIEASLKSDQEQFVARASLLYDMKPREIYAQWHTEFENVDQVRRVKGNLMARLRRDEALLTLLEAFD